MEGALDLFRRDPHQFQWWAAWLLGAQSYQEAQEVKKGADRGIDGNIFFANGPYGTGRIIVSVKGGENLGVGMVRDLRGVIEREGAEMGVLICLHEPTSNMITEAAAAGFVRQSAHGRKPRLQVITIADLFAGKKPDFPPIPTPERIRARPETQKESDQLELLLPFDRKTVKTARGEFVDPRILKFGRVG